MARKWDFIIKANATIPGFNSNFYGLGNDTEALRTDDNFYHVMRFNQILLEAGLRWAKEGNPHQLFIGPYYQYFSVQEEADADNSDRFVFNEARDLNLIPIEDFEGKQFGGLKIGYSFNTTDIDFAPQKGVKINASATYFTRFTESNVYDNGNFLRLQGNLSTYLEMKALSSVLAVRVGRAHLFGDDFEFYQANTLGGLSMLLNDPNLRGYRRSRFAGRSTLYQNFELRTVLINIPNYVATFRLGIMGTFDNGRVWSDGEDSSTWHQGYGAGIWIAPLDAMVLAIQWTWSTEDQLLAFNYGFRF
ncbi:MAG: BamA/TamA family outer membrane protein [Bacteroidota bacterium]